MDKNNNRLSFTRFRDLDLNKLNKSDAFDYQFSLLMKSMIEILEGALSNPQQFNRCKFSVLSAFHSFLEKYDKIKDSSDVK